MKLITQLSALATVSILFAKSVTPLILGFQDEHVIWNGNQIHTVHGNHGDIVSYHVTGSSGLEWPGGSGRTAVFHSGIWLASGKVRSGSSGEWKQEIRTAASAYNTEFVPGNWDEQNNGHIYQIHREEVDAFLKNDYGIYTSMSARLPVTRIEGTTISSDTVESFFPTDDFRNWPAATGAPWVDANGDGLYNIKDGDHPDILGDTFHWYVMNDGDSIQHKILYNRKPMGVEIQTSVFGFNDSGPLGNVLFYRWVIINRGIYDLDSVFVSLWHDDDLGDPMDDLVGCDPDLGLGYTYNGPNGDTVYGLEVPAVGTDIIQGPIISSPGDTAEVLTWNRNDGYTITKMPDRRELGLISFVKFGGNSFSAPFRFPRSAGQVYNYMNGRDGRTGRIYLDPFTGKKTSFIYTGDPVEGSGWLDDSPGDRQFLITTGPFYLGAGDTTSLVSSLVIAAGQDWRLSITKMRYYDILAQSAYDAVFQNCSLDPPKVQVSQLDQKIVLSFEENSSLIEDYDCGEYTFQGYNIYQGQTLTGPWERLATFDRIDGIKAILDLVHDEETGFLLELPVQYGTDSGIRHYIEIADDVFQDTTLINYRKYIFAVSAYVYDPHAAQRVIESPLVPVETIPGIPGVGSILMADNSDTLPVIHISGTADAQVVPRVIDPYQLTGDTYELTFHLAESSTQGPEYFWSLANLSRNSMVILENTDVTSGPIITLTDGFALGIVRGVYEVELESATTTVDSDTSTMIVFEGLQSEGTWSEFLATLPISQPSGMADITDLQQDLEIRFTRKGSIGILFKPQLSLVDTIRLPFELWSLEETPHQIITAVYQIGGRSGPLFEPVPGSGTGYQLRMNVHFIPVYEDYNETAVVDHDYHWAEDADKMGWLLAFNKNQTQQKDKTVWEIGNVFQLRFINPIIPGTEVYRFAGVGLVPIDASLVQKQIDAINVYPNPFFGRNILERSPAGGRVYFTHLGKGTTTIRIFTISGDLVHKIVKSITQENDPDNRVEWDLRNSNGLAVASGMYLAHILVQDPSGKSLGEKLIKLAIFQPEGRLFGN